MSPINQRTPSNRLRGPVVSGVYSFESAHVVAETRICTLARVRENLSDVVVTLSSLTVAVAATIAGVL